MDTPSTIPDRLHVLDFAHIPLYIGCFVGVLCLKFILTALYNVYFHPLRKYPGPKLAAVTNLVFHYHALRGNEAKWEHHVHQTYGEVVRLAPNKLSYITPQAWNDIAGYTAGNRLENAKAPGLLGAHENGVVSLSAIYDTQEHRQRRKSYAHAFSNRALTLQEPLISKYVQMLLDNLREVAAGPDTKTDFVRHFNFTTFDIMGDLAFGESLGLLKASEYTPWVKAVVGNIQYLPWARLFVEYPTLRQLVALFTRSLRDLSREHFENAASRVDIRLAKGIDAGKPDIWNLILQQHDKNGLTEEEMKSDASSFMRAGTETTATLLSGAVYYLLKNPDKMKILVEEIRSLKREELSLVNLQRAKYLDACLTEALRIYPPIAIAIFRATPKGGNVIEGQWVPENTQVGVAHFAAYHSALNFKNPDNFVPERWLPDTGYDSDRKDVLNPFSFGPRNCLGQNLARHELRIILSSVLWHFDLELCPESETWVDQKVLAVWAKPPLWVKVKNIR